MEALISKAEAEAAVQLGGPPGRAYNVIGPEFSRFLETHERLLRQRHEAGAGGLEIAHARSAVMDIVLRHLLGALWPAAAKPLGQVPFTLVATGGYGRGELNPHSDVDLLFLEGGGVIRDDGSTPLSLVPPAFIQAMYDLGMEPGDQAVRTVDQCVRLAARDMEAKTSLLEVRFLAGDEKLFRRLQQTVFEKCIRGRESEYISARLADQAARRAKHGDSPCMQEPHLKNGVGGLRDYQNLLWMALVRYGVRDFADLERREMLSSNERSQLEHAYDFILRVRNELHYAAGHRADTLTPNYQPAVAAGLKYPGDPRRRTEAFMRDYYNAARAIHLITRTLEERLALTAGERGKRTWRDLLRLRRQTGREEFDGFTLSGGQLHCLDFQTLRNNPARLMRAFLHAQTRGVGLDPDLSQFLRRHSVRLGEEFRHDSHVRETFLKILSARGNVAPALRLMHDVDLLGQYLPEFGRLTNLVQHEYYHRYTVDEHTLVCIEKLDQVWLSEQAPYVRYKDLFRRIDRPELLYLALLLHDSGKAEATGRHAAVGGELAVPVAGRLQLDPKNTAALKLIIELHLAMVQTAQKRDLEDPVVIRAFSEQVQTIENLELLTLHTFADSMGTSESLWSGFKDGLHWELYLRTRDLLAGDTGALRAEAEHRSMLLSELRTLVPPTIGDDEFTAHFRGMPARYFRTNSARQLLRDIVMAHQFMHLQLTEEDRALDPIIQWHDEPDRGHAVVHVCTWDRAGLFAKITGALAAASLNIFGAEVTTRADGVIFDEFYVADARTGQLPAKEAKQKFEHILLEVLTGEFALAPAIARTRLLRPLWEGVAGHQLPTNVRVDNAASADRTLIEIETEDRVGLLYAISQALVDLKLDLVLAKISTEKGAAIDTFYVTEIGGGQVLDEARQRHIAERLRDAISAHEV